MLMRDTVHATFISFFCQVFLRVSFFEAKRETREKNSAQIDGEHHHHLISLD